MKSPHIVDAVIPPELVKQMREPKRSCKMCYGRGTVLHLPTGDGYKIEKFQSPLGGHPLERRVSDLRRNRLPCHCIFRGQPKEKVPFNKL